MRRHRLDGCHPAQLHGISGQVAGEGRLLRGEVDVFLAHTPTVLALQPLHRHPQHYRLPADRHGAEVAEHNA